MPKFFEGYFHRNDVISKEVKDVLNKESKKPCESNEQVGNLCRLWIVVILSIFLMPNNRMEIKGFSLNYIMNMDELFLYNWAQCVQSQLFATWRNVVIRCYNKKPNRSLLTYIVELGSKTIREWIVSFRNLQIVAECICKNTNQTTQNCK